MKFVAHARFQVSKPCLWGAMGVAVPHALAFPELDLAERILKQDVDTSVDAIMTIVADRCGVSAIEAILARFPRCRLIAQYGVGFNNIDVDYATSKNLRVTNTPDVLADATADTAIALILMSLRRFFEGALTMHQDGGFGGWSPGSHLGCDLKGRTLGIVGLGSIGHEVAKRAAALGMKIVALQSEWGNAKAEGNIPRLPEDAFLAAADVLTFHCRLTDKSKDWLDAKRIRKLKKGSFVINTSRGEVVNENALADALLSGHLAGAGLDVFVGEPVLSSVLRAAPNLVVLPHLGSATLETRTAMSRLVVENIAALARCQASQKLPTQIN